MSAAEPARGQDGGPGSSIRGCRTPPPAQPRGRESSGLEDLAGDLELVTWESYLASQGLSFFICKVGIRGPPAVKQMLPESRCCPSLAVGLGQVT